MSTIFSSLFIVPRTQSKRQRLCVFVVAVLQHGCQWLQMSLVAHYNSSERM